MKKILIVCVACISGAILFADSDPGIEKFQKYNQEQNTDNLVEVIHYFTNESDDKFLSAQILGNVYLNELEKQLAFFETNLDSLSYRNLFAYANLLLAAGKYEECIGIYDRLNDSAPDWSCPWRHKGEAYFKLANYEEAEKATLKAIETREDHLDAYVQLAKIQKASGNYEAALETLDKSLSYLQNDIEEEVGKTEILELKEELLQLIEK